MRALVVALAACPFAALLAGCGASAPLTEPNANAPHRAAPLGIDVALPRHLSAHGTCTHLRPSPTRSYAALVRRATTATGGAKLARRDVNGYRTVLGVLSAHVDANCRPTLVHVQLPGPPNGRAGWVRARSVRVFPVADRIVVDLSARRLVAYQRGRPRLNTRVAVGAPRMPTPTGRYVVNERWLLDNPNGAFGIAALGISAHSTVLHHWLQGGPVAIHGTNEPWSIGRPESHGCIRLRNVAMRRLLHFAPAGTPVDIHP